MPNINEQLLTLTQAIEKLINKQVASVAPVAPVLPLAPVNTGDHDLLTKLDTKVDQIQLDVSVLKNQGSQFITLPQHQELATEINDHENRIRVIEKAITQILTWGVIGMIALGVVETLILRYVK